jgi:RNA polymerase sigma-70 factor (ECF subfamily)
MLSTLTASDDMKIDLATFAAIYAREFAYVSSNVRSLGVPLRDLPDVTQNVFVAVFKNLWKYDESRGFRPWLFGVLIRVTSDHLRLARNHREVLELDQVPERVDLSRQPDATVELRERWRIIDAGIRRLDVRRRTVLVLHDIEGREAKDIARAMNLPLKTVYSRLQSARVHLAKKTTMATVSDEKVNLTGRGADVAASTTPRRRATASAAEGRGPTS